MKSFGIHPVTQASLMLVLGVASLSVYAQQANPAPVRTDGNPSTTETVREAAKLPAPALPKATPQDGVTVPQYRRAEVRSTVQFKPAGFKVTGATLIPETELLALIEDARGKQLGFNELADLADRIKRRYIKAGYILTDVYFPEQSIDAEGGTVEFVVVEARIGQVRVTNHDPKAGISKETAESVLRAYLPAGTLISQYRLDRPILLLRDLSGVDATATVVPGKEPGEADLLVDIQPKGQRFEGVITADNQGARSTGEYRAGLSASWNHPLGLGDVLSLRYQPTAGAKNDLYRLGYMTPVGPYATKVVASLTQSRYRLGEPFEALDASGTAKIASMSVLQPVVRGRLTNIVAIAGVDRKDLNDLTGALRQNLNQRIDTVRLGMMGSTTDEWRGGGNTYYSVMLTAGKASFLNSDAVDLDQSLGRFGKVNFELQRTQFLTDRWSLYAGASGQWANRNLRGSERISLGGPNGVRGYGVPSGNADTGVLFQLEGRYRTGWQLLKAPVNLVAFADAATLKARHTPVVDATGHAAENRSTVAAFGGGVRMGGERGPSGSIYVARPFSNKTEIATDGLQKERSRRVQVWAAFQYSF